MRRLVSLPLGVLAAAALVVTPVLAGTSAASTAKGPAAHGHGSHAAHKPAAKPAAKPAPKPSKAKSKVVVVGVVSDTATVTTSGTSSVTITVKVQGGDKEYKGKTVSITIDKNTVVKRNHGKKTRYELRKGDKVTVHARRAADGALTAFYVAASGSNAAKPVTSPAAATSTATSTATTS
ncbi:MAG: hypothetical protein JWO60_2123 [Frankiales bacterium]|nr:hypothetical protein [Frankiales bacterium]